MKNFVTFISCAAVTACLFVSTANADTLTSANDGKWGNGVKTNSTISDGKRWGEDALYQWVNSVYSVDAINAVFGNGEYDLTKGFTSSDQMYALMGVDYNKTTWTAGANAYAQTYYRQADLTHDLSVIDGDGVKHSLGTFTKADNSSVYGASEIGSAVAIAEGEFTLEFRAYGIAGYDQTFSTIAADNKDGFAHILGFDVTDLVNYGKSVGDEGWVTSAYLFGFEDLLAKHSGVDWDYNDMITVVYDLEGRATSSGDSSSTPEPATLAFFGLGCVALPVVRRFRRK